MEDRVLVWAHAGLSRFSFQSNLRLFILKHNGWFLIFTHNVIVKLEMQETWYFVYYFVRKYYQILVTQKLIYTTHPHYTI